MSKNHRLQVSAAVATIAVVSMLLAGAGGMYFVMSDRRLPSAMPSTAPAATPAAPPPAAPAAGNRSSPLPDVVVPLTADAAKRAGIELAQVTAQPATDGLRLPGVVEPNAYRQVSITPLLSGRVISVSAQLGDRVRKGQSLAQVYSPEVAEARTRYVSARAMLEAHDRELQRTQKLAEIGAASRQELERIHAEHAAQSAEVESARARLQLLGGSDSSPSASQADATAAVRAPIDGVVTERLANIGLNVDPSAKLFTVVDLSNVWVVANVYERDLPHVKEGTRATVTTTAFPARPQQGRVTFIDPQLDTSTRTAKIRVEVANPRGDLRLGMYTDVTVVSPAAATALSIPKDAVQSVGDRPFVYLLSSKDPATFLEREVHLGRAMGDRVEVLSGLSTGDSVVSKGSFFVRAEAERLGLRSTREQAAGASPSAAGTSVAEIQTAKIAVTEKGFEPDSVNLRAGSLARLTFVRTTDKTCATEVALPSLKITRALPLNQPVTIELTPAKTGEVAFACGMGMLKGVLVVQ